MPAQSSPSSPGYLPVAELTALYRSGRLSPVETVTDCLARIDRHGPAVGAFCLVDAGAALAMARASAGRWHRGEPLGPLDGVPVAVKDLFLTAGWPTLRGSRTIGEAGPWQVDSPAVARLREQGAVLIGKTTTPELGWKAVTDSPLTGVTRNPWNLSLTPGGSSGGSAAALAAGMATLALGTDGGGSIRIPAAFCGVAGFKPTYGRVPYWPASPFAVLAHAGPMARCIADAAALLEVIAGPDPRDTLSLPPPTAPFAGQIGAPIAGTAVAYCPSFGADVDPQIAAATRRAATALERLGAIVTEVEPPFDDPVAAFTALWDAGAAKAVAAIPPARRELLDPGLARIAERGARLSAVDYLGALAERDALAGRLAALTARYPLLLTPAVPVPPFAAGRDTPQGWPVPDWPAWTPFSYPFNLSHQPAAVVRWGFTSAGLPVGVQLAGPRHGDRLVLRAAHAVEMAAPDIERLPPLG